MTTPDSGDQQPSLAGTTLDAQGSMLLPLVEPGSRVAVTVQGRTVVHTVKHVDKLAGTITFDDNPVSLDVAPGWTVIVDNPDSIHDHCHQEDQ